MQDVGSVNSSLTRDPAEPPAWEAGSLSHWAAREVVFDVMEQRPGRVPLSDSSSRSAPRFLSVTGAQGARGEEEALAGGRWGQRRHRGRHRRQEQGGRRESEETERPLIAFVKT